MRREEVAQFFLGAVDESFPRNWRVREACTPGGKSGELQSQRNFSAKIPLPSYAEQREIAAAIAAVDRKIEHHRRKHAALSALFRTLLHELMTARIRIHDTDLRPVEVCAR